MRLARDGESDPSDPSGNCSEASSLLKLMDSCITQLQARGPSRTLSRITKKIRHGTACQRERRSSEQERERETETATDRDRQTDRGRPRCRTWEREEREREKDRGRERERHLGESALHGKLGTRACQNPVQAQNLRGM